MIIIILHNKKKQINKKPLEFLYCFTKDWWRIGILQEIYDN